MDMSRPEPGREPPRGQRPNPCPAAEDPASLPGLTDITAHPPRQSLVIRATLSILTVIALVGAFYLWLSHTLTAERETKGAQRHLEQLLETVQRPASIACFLNDPQLAGEVAEGLLANRMVRAVQIYAGPVRLAGGTRDIPPAIEDTRATMPVAIIVRPIASPFNSDEHVGEIRLTPDAQAIAERTAQATLFGGGLMLAQIVASGLTIVVVVYFYVTLPLRRMTRSLRSLPAEQGAELPCPRGHERDDFGELVEYINRLLRRLVKLLAEERQLRLQLEVEERRFRSIFENAATGIFLVDRTGMMLSHNPACRRILQLDAQSPVNVGPRLGLSHFFCGDRARARAFIDLCIQQNRSIHQDLKLSDRLRESTERWIHLTLTPIGGDIFQGVANDITERKRTEAKAIEAAMSDPLTGLLNRMGFIRMLQEQFRVARSRPSAWVALLLIDLDRFKPVNDTFGHDAGDQVLIGVGQMLQGLVRKSDLVGRVGGDEFVILLMDVEQPEAIEKIAQKILAGAATPYYIGAERTVRIGASIGIALSQLAQATQEVLFKQADEAMYEAKRAGRNGYRVYGRGQPLIALPFAVAEEAAGDAR